MNDVEFQQAISDPATRAANAGLDVELVEDISARGNILRNWELVDTLAVRGIRGLLPWLIPPTLRMLTDGGLTLAKAARLGAFLIGHWKARKPGGNR